MPRLAAARRTGNQFYIGAPHDDRSVRSEAAVADYPSAFGITSGLCRFLSR